MALLSFSPAPAKGQVATVTLDKSYLLSMQAVAISDEYYTDPLNIKTVTVIYESEPGKQRYKLTFDFSSASPTAQLDLPDQARNNIFFKTLVLHDYENDKLKLSREQIVLSDESIVDLDISFGPMEETNEIVVTPSDGGDNLYEDFSELFVAKSGSTMTGALTLSGAPSSDLHAATKAYVDSEIEQLASLTQPSPTITVPALDIDWSLGEVFYKEVSINTTFTFSNATDGKGITLIVKNTSAGQAANLTFPTPLFKDVASSLYVGGNRTAMFSILRAGSNYYIAGISDMST